MSVRIGVGVSTAADAMLAGSNAGADALAGLGGAPAQLAVVFASGTHLRFAQELLDAIVSTLRPATLIGCGAGGVLGQGREHESGSAVAVLAASFGPADAVETFRLPAAGPALACEAWSPSPDRPLPSAVILLSDPHTFAVEGLLHALSDTAAGMPVLGGLASARTDDGTPLFFDGELVLQGAVGVALRGVEVLPCVSQGAAPLGPELTITAAAGNVIRELAGRPALVAIREAVERMSTREQALLASGLLVGIVIDSGKPEFVQGDFLVRGVLGADADSGAVAIAAPVQAGQVIRLHARDAESADEDLRRALRLQRAALSGQPPAGALVFSCNGRGRAMFGAPDHDVGALAQELGDVPAAGFFAAGEIGPVGGRSFLHGFTATIAAFPADAPFPADAASSTDGPERGDRP
jgi:small ligand-binding sensory domain FIST